MIEFTVNGKEQALDLDPEMPLLWALRDYLGLTGTKYGCGGGFCGACTVHVDKQATRACLVPLSAVAGRQVTTIESAGETGKLHPVQQSWLKVNVPQCGYCQPGQLMSAIALLEQNPSPSDAEIDAAMQGNLCRCGTYTRIRTAIRDAAKR